VLDREPYVLVEDDNPFEQLVEAREPYVDVEQLVPSEKVVEEREPYVLVEDDNPFEHVVDEREPYVDVEQLAALACGIKPRLLEKTTMDNITNIFLDILFSLPESLLYLI
jgi:hypothetical protein